MLKLTDPVPLNELSLGDFSLVLGRGVFGCIIGVSGCFFIQEGSNGDFYSIIY